MFLLPWKNCTMREPNICKPHGFFLGFLTTCICFCVITLFFFLVLLVFCGKNKMLLLKDLKPKGGTLTFLYFKINLHEIHFLANKQPGDQ